MTGDQIITVQGLEHRFGDTVAVDGISFSLQKGEIFSFLGPNGAGKSTVINILTTLLSPQTGEIRIAGFDPASKPDMVRRSIGVVFQNEVLDRDLTVWETMEFHGRLYSLPKEERRTVIDTMIRLVDLDAKRNVLTKHLSGGMRRRLEIARGLMTSPKILFLDEPTIGLDPHTRLKMWDYIRDVNQSGVTIFLTTHYMDEADSLSDRIAIIDKGKIIADGTPDQLKSTLGQDMISIETDDNEAARTLLRENSGIFAVHQDAPGSMILLTTEGDGTHVLPLVLTILRKGDITVHGINLKKPTMDDVFVHYTGRRLRDGGNQKPQNGEE